MRRIFICVALCFVFWLSACANPAEVENEQAQVETKRPNILLIVADDLGYSDIGAFGGEINTPNLDSLAQTGIQLTGFHTASSCSPTRSMLMTGTDNHLVGLGNTAEVMELLAPEYLGHPGYEGYLNFEAATLPELLKDAGYRTYMTGKWHLGLEERTSPTSRGFDKAYALLDGCSGHFDDRQFFPCTTASKATLWENGAEVGFPADFYSTRTFADKLIEFLQADKGSDSPFFAYLAFTAPHWPLQAPEASIAKYKNVYDDGYEVFFDRRLKRQKELQLIDRNVNGQPLIAGLRPWEELSPEERRFSARKMAVYAAMVDDMDTYIGHVVDALKAMGEYEDTVIVFMSDNGPDSARTDRIAAIDAFVKKCCDNRFDNMGRPNSFLLYGPEWARVSSVPSKYFKSHTTQGGILSPAIVSYPNGNMAVGKYEEFLTVMDLLPTFLELANTRHPGAHYNGGDVLLPKGKSFASILAGSASPIHGDDHVVGWEVFNHRALRKGNWKLVLTTPPFGDMQWKLHNLADDPSESTDLSAMYPAKLEEMLGHWDDYVADNGVIFPTREPR